MTGPLFRRFEFFQRWQLKKKKKMTDWCIKWKYYFVLVLFQSTKFKKDDSSKLNNHSAMAVGKFILALSFQFEFCFILWLFSLRFYIKKSVKLNYKNKQLIFFFFVSLRFEWKNQRAHFRMAGYDRHTMCTSASGFCAIDDLQCAHWDDRL